jgi:prevent-host-death family protein
MREMSVREANQNFSQLIAAAEQGETIVITKNGKPVARVSPQPADRRDDPEWQAAYEALKASLEAALPLGRPREAFDRDALYERNAEGEQ